MAGPDVQHGFQLALFMALAVPLVRGGKPSSVQFGQEDFHNPHPGQPGAVGVGNVGAHLCDLVVHELTLSGFLPGEFA